MVYQKLITTLAVLMEAWPHIEDSRRADLLIDYGSMLTVVGYKIGIGDEKTAEDILDKMYENMEAIFNV